MSQQNPYRIFVTHDWVEDEDYLRVFEFLEGAPNFYYQNVANPTAPAQANAAEARELLRAQIRQCEVVVALASQHATAASALEFQLVFAQVCKKSIVLLRAFGSNQTLPISLTQHAKEILDWDERGLVAAIKRLARGEGGPRWDTVEFTPD